MDSILVYKTGGEKKRQKPTLQTRAYDVYYPYDVCFSTLGQKMQIEITDKDQHDLRLFALKKLCFEITAAGDCSRYLKAGLSIERQTCMY